MASKRKNKKATAADPGLGFSPYRHTASMTRTDSQQDVKQRERKKAKAYAKGDWKREY